MSLKVACLGSGSRGNAWLVAAGETCIMIDCGFSLAEVEKRLIRLGLEPEKINAIVVTHEHGDHSMGVSRMSKRYKLPVWMTSGTAQGVRRKQCYRVMRISPDEQFEIGDLQIQSFTVPHDSREPVQFVVTDGDRSYGQLTDCGCPTPHVASMLQGLNALAIECNYDADMLEKGPYPPALKRRVAGNYGHLGNHQTTDLLSRLDLGRLEWIMGAHLSEKNNTPLLAQQILAAAVGSNRADEMLLAHQDEGSPWLRV